MKRKARDSSGISEFVETPQERRDEEAPQSPRGKGVPVAQINQQDDQGTINN
ncbi:hypothetical protein [Heyndrickxia acidicola]|uniref:Spore protein n=1 Tax=Heyndrickxia acidicola TaxID=209389 RepID=A0ABU6MFD7_9BACI|nr:hypothetical protein [Heyndrickxia acidicola]